MPVHDATSSRAHWRELLHALNQPITGLQCLLEIRNSDAHAEELHLVARMRRIAQAMRVMLEIESSSEARVDFDVAEQLKEIVEELQPVAEAGGVRLEYRLRGELKLCARAQLLRQAWFRTLNAVLVQSRPGGTVKVSVQDAGRTFVQLSWSGCEACDAIESAGGETGEARTEKSLDWRLARIALENEDATWQVMHTPTSSTLMVRFERANGAATQVEGESENHDARV